MQETSFQAIVEIAPEIVKDPGDDEFIGYFEGVASTPQIDIEGDAFSVDVLQANAERLKGKEILYGHGKDPALRDTPVGKILDAWIENVSSRLRLEYSRNLLMSGIRSSQAYLGAYL